MKIFVILGDGECNEGSIWEAAALAGHMKLSNLIVIIDKNNLQLDGYTKTVLNMDKLSEKMKVFGFEVREVDGHNMDELRAAFIIKSDKPLAIIAKTIKGKGVSFAENNVDWHQNFLDEELYIRAMEEQEVL